MKSFEAFDFVAIPGRYQTLRLELARCGYIDNNVATTFYGQPSCGQHRLNHSE